MSEMIESMSEEKGEIVFIKEGEDPAIIDPDEIFDAQRLRGHSSKYRGKHRQQTSGADMMAFFRKPPRE